MDAAAMITLTLKEQPVVPLEAEAISPDVIACLSDTGVRVSKPTSKVSSSGNITGTVFSSDFLATS